MSLPTLTSISTPTGILSGESGARLRHLTTRISASHWRSSRNPGDRPAQDRSRALKPSDDLLPPGSTHFTTFAFRNSLFSRAIWLTEISLVHSASQA